MNSRDDLYLRQAEHCRRMSDASQSEQTKVEWLMLAERWLRMIRNEGPKPAGVRFEPESERKQA